MSALEHSEQRTSVILDAITEGVVVQDSHGRIIEWNAAAARLLGLSAREVGDEAPVDASFGSTRIDGTPWPNDAHPGMVALHTQRPVLGEIIGVQQLDGRHVWLRLDARPIIGENAESHHVVTTFADVTTEIDESHQRHMLEEALRRSEETARIALDALEQGVVLTDHSGSILRINQATERILGFTAQQLSELWNDGRWESDDDDCDDGARLPVSDTPITRAMVTGRAIEGEVVRWRHSNGDQIVLRVSVVPNADEAGGTLVALTDITKERGIATELAQLKQQLAHRTLHDPLTELANRQMLESSIEGALTRRPRNRAPVALCCIDLDGFAQVNDIFGYAAGNALLVSIAGKIRDSVREGDLAARVGGDEFVIMLDPVTDAAHALVVANRVRDRLMADPEPTPDSIGNVPSCAASIGVAVSRHGDTVASLLTRADTAMQRAKTLGASSVELAV